MDKRFVGILVALEEGVSEEYAKYVAEHLKALRGVSEVKLIETPGLFEEESVRMQEKSRLSDLVLELHAKIWEKP